MKRGPQPRDDKTMIKELRSKIYYLRKGIREKLNTMTGDKVYKLLDNLMQECMHDINRDRDDEEEELINTTKVTLHQFRCFICKKYNK